MDGEYRKMASSSDDVTLNMSENNVKYGELDEDNVSAQPPGFYEQFIAPRMNKGFMSNLATFVIMIIGIIMVVAADASGNKNRYVIGDYVLAFGLFGFAGGITNWLAIKMLFDKIPGVYGSGIIPLRFREIREVVKNVIMKSFFDSTFLERYLKEKAGELAASLNVEEKIRQMLQSPAVDDIIDKKLVELAGRPEGMILAMMGLAPEQLKPMVKPFVVGMASDVAPMLLDAVLGKNGDGLPIDLIRREIDSLMTRKLEELTPEVVKGLLEEVMRDHLGWLILWGNVFGGLIGVVSELVVLIYHS
jgi:hypothetical protein